ncbi:MAG: sugar ABC transporter permease [Solobacterium sp.]|nr:sugar ABC transporter permease [Solobacterium sp.]
MKQISDLEYLRMTKIQKLLYRLQSFFVRIPRWFKNLGLSILQLIQQFFLGIKNEFLDIYLTFKNGDYKTRLSFLIMGFGSIARGQILRGLLFLLFEVVFIAYMIMAGGYWLGKLPSLGTRGPAEEYNEKLDQYVMTYHDNSFKILLYGILTILFIIALIYTWRVNIKQNKIAEEILKKGKKLKSGKDDLRSLIDDQFHKTLLALPLTGIIVFTALPILFMILIAFTNYDANHNGYSNALFTWVGNSNFNQLITWSSGSTNFSATFGEILTWTLIWAFFATFTNYFLGIMVALMINKKGIKFKKLWRTILVMTIAIPQFISLLYVSKMFSDSGIVNGWLMDLGIVNLSSRIQFWNDPTLARIMVILINIWIGIPYLMLIATGILMNIPADLYESAKIDGASTFQQFRKITMPYMLFVTGPYLLTSFIGNINNFNVIFLLTGGGPTNQAYTTSGGSAGYTDLLITWLFKITTVDSNYKLAAVIGIAVFAVSAGISLIVYNVMPSMKNEEEFQ